MKRSHGKTVIALFAIGSLLAAAGCSSFSSAIQADVSPYGQPTPAEASLPSVPPPANPVADRAAQLRLATKEQLRPYLTYAEDHPGEVYQSIDVTQTKDGAIKVLFVANSDKGFFPAGVYSLKNTPPESRNGLAFMDLTSSAIAGVVSEVKRLGGPSRVTVMIDYAAQSDGIAMRGLRYAGDLGKIDLPAEITTVNGKPTSVKISAGQLVTNEELAALRAYSMRSFVHGRLGGNNLAERYELTTTKERGPSHRWVKVTLQIVPAT
ncbi:MAG: hypothetical protein WCJ87_02205 [Burkholderiales bacterium]|jgi:hypothetical protein